jgi:signal transduction histidine kinase
MGLFNSKEKDVLRKQREIFDVIGHELRTPLSIIKVNTGLLKDKQFKEGEEHIDRIEEALDRASKLLEAMLSTAKIEEGKLDLKLDKVELISVIRDALLSVEKAAKEKSLNIVLNFQADEVFVYADKVRLQQIVDNFLSNAVKYTDRGEVRIKVELENETVSISFEDTGVGISQDALSKLGEKFFRGESDNENEDLLVKPGGTGLGLYIAFNLISAMGGSFKVQSTLGQGSTFSFTLPLYKGQQISKVEEEEKRDVFKRMGFTQ